MVVVLGIIILKRMQYFSFHWILNLCLNISGITFERIILLDLSLKYDCKILVYSYGRWHSSEAHSLVKYFEQIGSASIFNYNASNRPYLQFCKSRWIKSKKIFIEVMLSSTFKPFHILRDDKKRRCKSVVDRNNLSNKIENKCIMMHFIEFT